ncbi:basic proline-rich protein-like [Cervus canadensis]|uniref:basic proline-rich protein-like n=1 Tax=Cervus canadensis TaxID=1574408 RepID=UPI001C9E3042|nr:basic proline-rich protein-like [Cervus canadensis]
MLGLPPLSSPKAKQIETHLVVVSTSPDRPELDLPPVKTLRDEDRKLAPVSSRELQSHRSQAQHPRSRRNIKQEPGLRGQRQPTTLHARQKLSRRQDTTALRCTSRPSPGPAGSLGGLSALKVGPGLLCTWGARAVPLGVQCLYLVRRDYYYLHVKTRVHFQAGSSRRPSSHSDTPRGSGALAQAPQVEKPAELRRPSAAGERLWRGWPRPALQPAADACPALPSLAGQTRPEPRGCGSALRLRGARAARSRPAPPARPAPPSARAAASPPPSTRPPPPLRSRPGTLRKVARAAEAGGEEGRREAEAWTRRAATGPARERGACETRQSCLPFPRGFPRRGSARCPQGERGNMTSAPARLPPSLLPSLPPPPPPPPLLRQHTGRPPLAPTPARPLPPSLLPALPSLLSPPLPVPGDTRAQLQPAAPTPRAPGLRPLRPGGARLQPKNIFTLQPSEMSSLFLKNLVYFCCCCVCV